MISRSSHSESRGFALVEFMVSSLAMIMVGGLVYYLMNAGMVLFAKNTAVNLAHQQARVAVLTIEHDLHSAISIPQLTDATGSAIAGNGPAAGISFQVFARKSAPFELAAKADANQKKVLLKKNGADAPVAGQRLNLTLHQVEMDIAEVKTVGANWEVTLVANLDRTIEITFPEFVATPNDPTPSVTGFISEKYSYRVIGGQLRYFKPGPNRPAGGDVMANDITSATPFSIPTTPLGAAYNRFVAAINLSTADHTVGNRRFKSANMFLNSMVPYRAKLCYYQ